MPTDRSMLELVLAPAKIGLASRSGIIAATMAELEKLFPITLELSQLSC